MSQEIAVLYSVKHSFYEEVPIEKLVERARVIYQGGADPDLLEDIWVRLSYGQEHRLVDCVGWK